MYIVRKGLDTVATFYVELILNSRVTEKEIKMTKQNKNRKEQATLEQMVKSGSQIVMLREDGTDQPIEEIIESQPGLCDYPFDKDFHYDNWWN
jgi:hypothetical protein